MNPILDAVLRGFVQREHVRSYLQAESNQRRELRLQVMRLRRLRREAALSAQAELGEAQGTEQLPPES